jgi:outer membrane lipoprotein SlyB
MVLSACGPDYSPNTYATNAVQQANKVDQGVVVGVREVGVSASGTAGALVGGAAGGIAGAQVGTGAGTAFGALGGSLVGGIAGSAAEHVVGDTRAFEYIVRKPNGDLLSVTQKDADPLSIGQKVLVITGNQARIVPDYTVPVQEPPKQTAAAPKEPPPATTAPPLMPVQAAPLPAPDQPRMETGP